MADRPGRSPTIFARLRRYAVTPGRDAREDRLTEALAATLQAAPDAARALVSAFFAVKLAGIPSVTTQRRTDRGDRVDLEIRVGSDTRPEFVAWIEAKVDAVPGRDQAERYLTAARALGCEARVCWLLPVGVQVQGGTPEGVPVHTWQELAVALATWVDSLPPTMHDLHGPRLAAEFIRHLEQEEALAATQPFSAVDATAINQFPTAAAKLQLVVQHASALLHARWGALDGLAARGLPDFLEHVPTHSTGHTPWPWPSEHCFEWHGRLDKARESPNGEWVIGAGAAFPVASAPNDNEPWVTPALARGFEYGRGGGWMFLCRYLTLAELAAEGRQSQQSLFLAQWLSSTFQHLEDLPPS